MVIGTQGKMLLQGNRFDFVLENQKSKKFIKQAVLDKLATIYKCLGRAALLTLCPNRCKIITVKLYPFVENDDINDEIHLSANTQKT